MFRASIEQILATIRDKKRAQNPVSKFFQQHEKSVFFPAKRIKKG
tara:strand:+ start:366 stop:500 length:135 start_codon:yes stop_codon:yes gene_type:complete